MITILRNLVVKLTVDSVSLADQALTFDFEDRAGNLVRAYRYTDEKDESVVSCKYNDLRLTPGTEVLVLCDINYIHDAHDGSIEFKKVKLIESQVEHAKFSKFSESLLIDLISETRTSFPERIAMAAAHLGVDNTVLTEIIFPRSDDRDAYVQGLKDAHSHLRLEFLNSYEVFEYIDNSEVNSLPQVSRRKP